MSMCMFLIKRFESPERPLTRPLKSKLEQLPRRSQTQKPFLMNCRSGRSVRPALGFQIVRYLPLLKPSFWQPLTSLRTR